MPFLILPNSTYLQKINLHSLSTLQYGQGSQPTTLILQFRAPDKGFDETVRLTLSNRACH